MTAFNLFWSPGRAAYKPTRKHSSPLVILALQGANPNSSDKREKQTHTLKEFYRALLPQVFYYSVVQHVNLQ